MFNLTHLQLNNNLITETDFPKDTSRLAKTLKYLDLSGNRLTSIPPQVYEFTGKNFGLKTTNLIQKVGKSYFNFLHI